MRQSVRNTVVGLGAAAALVFTLDEIGVTRIAPGHDTGFEIVKTSSQPDSEITFTVKRQITCWLCLKLAGVDSVVSAHVSRASDDLVVFEGKKAGWWHVTTLDTSGVNELFTWRSGGLLTVKTVNANAGIGLDDWRIDLADGREYDSLSRARRRTYFFWISLFLMGLSVAGVAMSAFEQRRKPLFGVDRCLRLIIGGVEGRNPEETRRMQRILNDVLFRGASVESALESASIDQKQRMRFYLQALGKFRKQLLFFIQGLSIALRQVTMTTERRDVRRESVEKTDRSDRDRHRTTASRPSADD